MKVTTKWMQIKIMALNYNKKLYKIIFIKLALHILNMQGVQYVYIT